ncbi:MAG: nucleoside hydrolase [Clostridia bacterium]|nr:nucleoside hydrolase [Clostridia bacterium]
MTQEQYFKNLNVPKGKIDVVLDTDAYNEIDDQFAICYMLRSPQKFCIKGICAAPFFNSRSVSAADGMIKSYDEILNLLTLAGEEELKSTVFKGSESYLANETTPVNSEAADFMAELAEHYSPEAPLYIVAIGAITNVASAILKNPKMKENCVVIWLGGHGVHVPLGASEFNMRQDIAAARVVFGCGIPLVQLPCMGVVDHFATSKYELEHWLKEKNPLCDYLYKNAVEEAESYAAGKPWTRVIWDVTAVAWLLDEDSKFMKDRLIQSPIPEYDKHYVFDENRHFIKYVYEIRRDVLFEDLFRVLSR